ncbi:chemotaxis protein CheD [Ostreiculturibacter nitratireducens]|uniref:chemotaxis protein CheD n=1 Tax=Ostreiculturibacter nitratireducens TaxID=3075226 RepID=UPI0031B6511F
MILTDSRAGLRPRHIAQGEFAVGAPDGQAITTILGSCVATCLHDPGARVGGMNHFLLPDCCVDGLHPASFGVNAMELLINALIKEGAVRSRLQAKVFGGARMIAGLSDIGTRNANFVLDFLRCEDIPCVAHSLGGALARRIMFWPGDGRARQRLLGRTGIVEEPPERSEGNGVELF